MNLFGILDVSPLRGSSAPGSTPGTAAPNWALKQPGGVEPLNWADSSDDGGAVLSRMQSSLFLQSFIGFASFKTHKRCFVSKRNQPTGEQIIM